MTEEFNIDFSVGFRPTITVGGNGNWYINGQDTGVQANVVNGDVTYTVPLDTTLTKAGNAADAAAAGDFIRNGVKIALFGADPLMEHVSGGRYLVNKKFNNGAVRCITFDTDEAAKVDVAIFYLKDGVYMPIWESGAIDGNGTIRIPVCRSFSNDFYIAFNVKSSSSGLKYKSAGSNKAAFINTDGEFFTEHENVQFADSFDFPFTVEYDTIGAVKDKYCYDYVLIGDSYGEGYSPDGNATSWTALLPEMLGLTKYEVGVGQLGGTGFCNPINGVTFGSLIEGFAAYEVKNFVVCGGWNDHGHTAPEIYQAIATTVLKFPRSRFTFGMIGYSTDAEIKAALVNNVLYAYQWASLSLTAGNNGGKIGYMSGAERILRDEWISSDGTHPNQDGQNALAMGIYNALMTGSCPKTYAEYAAEATGETGTDEAARELIQALSAKVESGNNITETSSHAEGTGTTASGKASHAEGYYTTASGTYSHAEGERTTAYGSYSHAEGSNAKAYGNYAHAEGYNTTARNYAHAEGSNTTASGYISHAEGSNTTASGEKSHAEGYYTNANYDCQHVQGKYNDNKEDSLFEIGNGTGSGSRSNAFRVTKDGNAIAQTKITVGNTSVTEEQLTKLLALIN